MKNVKKVLIGTALVGTLIVGTGFGTYSWFTSQAVSKGEVTNSIVKIDPNTDDFNFPTLDNENLAPSRSVLSDWIIFENQSNEDVRLKATYRATVTQSDYAAERFDGEPTLDKYSAAAYVIFSKNSTPGNWGNTLKTTMEYYLDNGQLPAGTGSGQLTIKLINHDNIVQSIQEAVTSSEDVALLFTETHIQDLFQSNGAWLMNENKYIHTMYGVKLADDAGNEYQGAELSVNLNLELRSVAEDVPAWVQNSRNN